MIVTICQSCPRVLSASGDWIVPPPGSDLARAFEAARRDGQLSHGICPEHAAIYRAEILTMKMRAKGESQ